MHKDLKKLVIVVVVLLGIYALIQLVGSFYTYLSKLLESNLSLAVLYVLTILLISCYVIQKYLPDVSSKIKEKIFKFNQKPHDYIEKNDEVEKSLKEKHLDDVSDTTNRQLVPIVGSAYVGKSAILSNFRKFLDSSNINTPDIELIELPSLGTDNKRNINNLKHYKPGDVLLLVVNHDLTNYEFEILRYAGENFRNVLILLNKIDNLSKQALSEIDAMIIKRVSELTGNFIGPLHLKADPKPITRIVVDDKDRETETQFRPDPDFEDLFKHVTTSLWY